MPGRYGKISNRTLTLRLAGGVIAGTALIGGIALSPAGTTPAKSQLGQGTTDLVGSLPAGAVAMAAADTPVTAPQENVPLRAAAPQQALTKQDAPQQAPAKQTAPQKAVAQKAAPQKAVAKQSVPKTDPKQAPAKQAAPKQKAAAALASAADVINLAKKQIGIKEDSNGGGTKFQQWYMSSPAAKKTVRRDGGSVSDYSDAAWCDMFVSWVGDHVGVKSMGEDAYTVAHARWFQKVGRWGQTPKPGAVVFYAWNGGGTDGIEHVGLVVKDNHDGTIDTVEGNTSNAVMERQRSVDSVVGYGYPQYAK